MKVKKKIEIKNKIICPYCGYEYTISEIFMPEDLLPNTGDVVRKQDGSIDFCLGAQELAKEDYLCDNCNHKFEVEPIISYKINKVDFEDNESVTIKLD